MVIGCWWDYESRGHVAVFCSVSGLSAAGGAALPWNRCHLLSSSAVSALTAARAALCGGLLLRLHAHDFFFLRFCVDSLYQQVLRVQNSNKSRGWKRRVGRGSLPQGRALQPGQWGGSTWLDCGHFGASTLRRTSSPAGGLLTIAQKGCGCVPPLAT